MRPLVIYHGNCADGFGAAWTLWKYFKGEADFYPGVYQRKPPSVKDRFVIFVDFSYKRPVLQQMANEACSILVLDHHKTAAADLEPDPLDDFFAVPKGTSWTEFSAELQEWGPASKGVYSLFDMQRSGAGLTWDFFNPGKPRPTIINHIEDRDLWRFKLVNTREIQATMFSLPYDFEVWDDTINEVEENRNALNRLIDSGEAIERKAQKDIAELIEVVTRPMRFSVPEDLVQDYEQPRITVPMANLPYTLTSDAGHLLCERNWYGMTPESEAEYLKNGGDARNHGGYHHLFAGCYWDKPDGRCFSLRSQENGADVGEIAKLYGGGGHARASGFTVPYSKLWQFEP
jgi:oligoribonuclease NrnB/cAMP/cGMP phosphodiesterase (DHH superfamily)